MTSSATPIVSIVIPAFNRVAPLRQTLGSVRAAAERLSEPVEILLVDDGSEPPLEPQLASECEGTPIRFLRQVNGGSILARQAGLQASVGEFVLFLDSDDLIAPDKLRLHVTALRAARADICYDDVGELATAGRLPGNQTRNRFANVDTVEDLVLRVQPPPHGPIYRRDYLLRALAQPIVAPLRTYDAVGDVWLYYNLCVHPARITKIDAPLSLIGVHDDARYSQHWERLGFAALGVMEAFMRNCPQTPDTERARMIVGECAFNSWRRLPRQFDSSFETRLLAIWRCAPSHDQMKLGGPLFKALSSFFGYVIAARLLRLRNAPYERVRTIDDHELAQLANR